MRSRDVPPTQHPLRTFDYLQEIEGSTKPLKVNTNFADVSANLGFAEVNFCGVLLRS
jgi:hypothetical protein